MTKTCDVEGLGREGMDVVGSFQVLMPAAEAVPASPFRDISEWLSPSVLKVSVSDYYYKVFKSSVALCQSFRVVQHTWLAGCEVRTCPSCAPIQGVLGAAWPKPRPRAFREKLGRICPQRCHDTRWFQHMLGSGHNSGGF